MSTEKNPYRHSHIYPQEIECAACEWAAAQEADMSLDDDPNVETGSIQATEVTVTQYIRPDTTIGVRTVYSGDGSLSQVLGLLVLAAIDLYLRSDREEPS